MEHREQVAGIGRLAVFALYRLEPGDIRVGHRERQDARRHYLEFLAHVAAMGIEVLAQVLWLPKHLLPESVGCFKNPSGTDYICP